MATSKTPKHAARGPQLALLYLRISNDPEGREAGITRQRTDGAALCKRNGWTVVDEFADNDKSASRYARKVRPEFARMLAMVDSGQASRIVAYNLDRLLRNPKELEELIDRADRGTLTVTSLQGDIDLAGEDGRFMARVLVAHAAKEADAISRRTRRGKAGARANGDVGGRVVALGWYGKRHGVDPTTGQPYLDNGTKQHPGEAKVIRKAVADFLTGASLAEIARRWNDQQVLCPQGAKHWASASVRAVLTNARNAGKVSYDGEIVGDGNWKPIIDFDSWKRVRARVDANADRDWLPRRRSLLTGLVRCGRCRQVMQRSTALTSGGARRPIYRCKRRPDNPKSCGGMSIDGTMLEAFLTTLLLDETDTRDLAKEARRRQRGQASSDVASDLAEIEQRMDELVDMLDGKTMTRRQFERRNAVLMSRHERLTATLQREQRDAPLDPLIGDGSLRKQWPSMSDDRRRAVFASVFEHVTIAQTKQRGRMLFDEGRVRPKWRY